MRRWWFRNLPAKATVLALALAAALIFYGLIQASPGTGTASASTQDQPTTTPTAPPASSPRTTTTPPAASSQQTPGEQITPAPKTPTPVPTQATRARRSRGS